MFSTYNFRFGGTQVVWVGDISVPITSTSGNWSAKSLGRLALASETGSQTYIAHKPKRREFLLV